MVRYSIKQGCRTNRNVPDNIYTWQLVDDIEVDCVD